MALKETFSSGVAAALQYSTGTSKAPQPTALALFSLANRVALVTGGHRGIGLEISLALGEAGATVYCIDLVDEPNDTWLAVQRYLAALPQSVYGGGKGQLKYIQGDVTDQKGMWQIAEDIVKDEGRLDICVCNAGILTGRDCLEYPGEEFAKLMKINVDGVLFTAQAAGRQMEKLGISGSIIAIASMSGSVTNKGQHWVAYNTSKSAVLQMTRSMACELAPKGIRVNSVSPGYIYTDMTRQYLDSQPHLKAEWESHNPSGRLGRPDELRGVVLWLASDASTFVVGSDIAIDGGHTAW